MAADSIHDADLEKEKVDSLGRVESGTHEVSCVRDYRPLRPTM
jgi:hypothetical protein